MYLKLLVLELINLQLYKVIANGFPKWVHQSAFPQATNKWSYWSTFVPTLGFIRFPFFKKFIYLFIYFWLCWVFASVRGPSLVAASGGHSSSRCAGLSLWRPLVAEHRLQTRRLSNCGSRTQPLRGMWDLPRPGLEPVCPALAGRFPTTAPPGKPSDSLFFDNKFLLMF